MPVPVAIPDASAQQTLSNAFRQAKQGLKGEFPDSLTDTPAPPQSLYDSLTHGPRGGGSKLSVTLGDTSDPTAGAVPTDVGDPGPTAQPVDIDGPADTAVPAEAPKQPSTFQGTGAEIGNGIMRGFAQLGRMAAVLGGMPVAEGADLLTGGTSAEDAVGSFIDKYANNAVDSWHPQPGTTGKGAQVVGDIASMVPALMTGPAAEALLPAQAATDAGMSSIQQGQDAKTATVLALTAALTTAAGMKLPLKSPSIVKRLASGIGGNIAVNAASSELTKQILKSRGYQEAAANIDPTDPQSLIESGVMGAIFGAIAGHGDSKAPAAGTPTPIDLGDNAGPAATAAPAAPAQVPDIPTAEPVSDLKAQVADMHDPATPRKAVYLSPDNVADLGTAGIKSLAGDAKQIRNFDKKGGVLIVPDDAAAKAARELRGAEPDMQKVLGQLTGAGDGKTPEDTAVVQGQTPEGAVATEATVAPQEVPAAVQAAQDQGKTPVVTTPEAAVQRRAEMVATQHVPVSEPAATAEAPEPSPAPPAAEEAPASSIPPEENASPRAVLAEPSSALPASSPEDIGQQVQGKDASPAPEATLAKPKSALDQLPDAMKLLDKQETAPAGKRFPAKLPERGENAAAFGAALTAAAKEARGTVPDAAVDRAMDAAKAAMPLAGKTPEVIAKGQGIGHTRVSAIVDEMRKAARGLLGTPEPGDEVQVQTKAAELKARIERKAAAAEKAAAPTRADELKARAADRAPLVATRSKDHPQSAPEPAKPAPKEEHPGVETIPTKRHIMRGREVQALAEEMGVDPAEIAEAAERATGKRKGALMAFMQEMAGGLDLNKGWLPVMRWLNPKSSRDSPLTRGDHIKLNNLIARVGSAEPEDVPHARDALTNFMNDIHGKRLDDDAQDAVHRYAATRRRMAAMRDVLEASTAHTRDEDENGESMWSAQTRDYDPGAHVDAIDALRHDENGGRAPAVGDDWDKLNTALRNTRTASGRSFFAELLSRRGQFVSAHKLLDAIGTVAQKSDLGPHVAEVVNLLRRYAPDLPVKMTDTIVHPLTGEAQPGAGGLFHARTGSIQVLANLRHLDSMVHSILHEITHSATVWEVTNNHDGPLAQRLHGLLEEAQSLAARKYGADVLAHHLDYFTGGSKTLPPGVEYHHELYGLTNIKEMLAEVFTNPKFQDMLSDLDNSTRDSLDLDDPMRYGGSTPAPRPGLLGRIIDAITGFFKPRGDTQTGLLHDIISTGNDVMRAQQERFPFLQRTNPQEILQALGKRPNALLTNAHDDEALRSLTEDPPPMRGEDKVMRGMPESMRPVIRAFSHVTKSGGWDLARKSIKAWQSFDQLVRRNARLFGHAYDDSNPLRQYAETRARRDMVQNKLADRVAHVAEAWQKLTPAQDKRLGQFMIDSTVWGIDPTVDAEDHADTTQRMRGFNQRYDDFQKRWRNLTTDEQSVYESARDANAYLNKQSRKAAIDAAIRGYGDQLTPGQKQMLYAVRDPYGYDRLIGEGKPIDLGDSNDAAKNALRDLAGLHEMDGPYFHLGRDGSKVVQVKPEGAKTFGTKAEAEAFAEKVHNLSPGSKATVVADVGDQYTVNYEAHYVSMHNSPAEAEADAERMRQQGFDVGPVTEKNMGGQSAPLSYGMRELVSEAQRKIEAHGSDEGTQAMTQAMHAAFTQILASRSAYAASRLARKGVAGVKADEMRLNFARHARATAWHTANLSTVFQEAGALAKLREAAMNHEIGNADQRTMYQRGTVVSELGKRLQQDVQDYGVKKPLNSALAKLGFLNYLASPAHAFIWLTQNISTGIPVAGARYGYGRAAAAFARGMRSPALGAFNATLKGLMHKPGDVTHSDITQAVINAVRKDPHLGHWAEGENSHIQQLMDRGAINSTLSDAISTMSAGRPGVLNKAVAGATGGRVTTDQLFEYARLLPHVADVYNRLSTALAGLELTNGHVQKTADLVREIHVDYGASNKPRAFKAIGRYPGGNSVTMFKTYVQGMAHLLYSNVVDSITGEGKPRAEAAKTVAGMILGSMLFAGAVKSVPEPVHLAIYAYHKIFGDDDQFFSLDNSIHRFLTDHFGHTAGELMAGGVPRAAGFDLSTRMGLSDLFFHDPPDLLGGGKDAWRDMVYSMMGPVPSMMADAQQGFTNHMARGEPFQAAMSLVPIKALHDAQKAYTLATKGRQNSAGVTIVSPQKFSAYDAGLQAFGLKPAKTADLQEKSETAYDYKNWAYGRKQSLIAGYMSAAPDERSDAMKQIQAWNKANPGQRVTRSELIRQQRATQRAQMQPAGQPGRDPRLNQLLNY